jgi:hypothetical protein
LAQFTLGLAELSAGDIRRLSATLGAADLPCRLAVLHIDREASRHNLASRGAIARAGRQAGGAVLQAAAREGGQESEARCVARVAREIARGLSAGPIGARHAGVLLEAWQGALAAPNDQPVKGPALRSKSLAHCA